MSDLYCPRCGLDTIRGDACTDPSCDYPNVARA